MLLFIVLSWIPFRLHTLHDIGACSRVRLPLGFGRAEEREELVAALPQARYHAWAAVGPRAPRRQPLTAA